MTTSTGLIGVRPICADGSNRATRINRQQDNKKGKGKEEEEDNKRKLLLMLLLLQTNLQMAVGVYVCMCVCVSLARKRDDQNRREAIKSTAAAAHYIGHCMQTKGRQAGRQIEYQ